MKRYFVIDPATNEKHRFASRQFAMSFANRTGGVIGIRMPKKRVH